jgi:type II secretory pathway pseudopilin PulG
MEKGFTLVEILAGIFIFVLVVGTATSLLISAFNAQKRALAIREVIDGASYVIDYMSRAISMAKKDDLEIRGIEFHCLPGYDFRNYYVDSSNPQITFRTYKLNECQSFFLDLGSKRIKERKTGQNYPVAEENYLTPEGLEVTNLKFFVQGDDQYDNLQPKVTIFLEIQKRGQPATKISLQTTITQKDLDF